MGCSLCSTVRLPLLPLFVGSYSTYNLYRLLVYICNTTTILATLHLLVVVLILIIISVIFFYYLHTTTDKNNIFFAPPPTTTTTTVLPSSLLLFFFFHSFFFSVLHYIQGFFREETHGLAAACRALRKWMEPSLCATVNV